jgi:hypothetical protein
MSLLPESLPHTWRQRALLLREWAASEESALLWERAATELEQALNTAGSETLTLTEAARLSGLTAGYLGDMIRAGKLPNAGRKHAPRVRRVDLPTGNGKRGPLQQRSRSRSKIADIADRLR